MAKQEGGDYWTFWRKLQKQKKTLRKMFKMWFNF